jgi:anti-anti-sigma regulatory factor
MAISEIAVAVRPGEHACCRFTEAEDQDRLTAAFVLRGLRHGHKVVYLCDGTDVDDARRRIGAEAPEVCEAAEHGRVKIVSGHSTYSPDGVFHPDRMVNAIRGEHADALTEGFTGLSITGEMIWATRGVPGAERLADYENSLEELLHDDTLVMLCQYEQVHFAAGVLSAVATTHQVDVRPELAALGRDGSLAAAHVRGDGSLRLAGELDFSSADALAAVLDAHYHGELRFDLEDLTYVDVAGMRALRGRKRQRITLLRPPAAVGRMIVLLGWDTDPDIVVVAS